MQTAHVEFAQSMASQPVELISEVAEDLHEKGYRLQLQAAFVQRQGGEIAGALSAIRKVVASAAASGHLAVQFDAILQAGQLEWMQLMKSDEPQARAPEKSWRLRWNSARSRSANLGTSIFLHN